MKAKFVMLDDGSFHIEVDARVGLNTTYEGIACLTVDDKLYIGVSEYYGGILPTECVLEVSKVE